LEIPIFNLQSDGRRFLAGSWISGCSKMLTVRFFVAFGARALGTYNQGAADFTTPFRQSNTGYLVNHNHGSKGQNFRNPSIYYYKSTCTLNYQIGESFDSFWQNLLLGPVNQLSLSILERLLKVGDDVLDMLSADRDTDKVLNSNC
jgi:hypothetical protein